MGETRIGQGRDAAKQYLKNNPEIADKLEADIRRNFDKLMTGQSRVAAKAAGRAVDVSADEIEKIERSKHKQERVLVYLEGGDLLRITESELLRFGLCIGLDIDDRTVVELQQSGARSETRARGEHDLVPPAVKPKELGKKKLREKGARSRPTPNRRATGSRRSAR